MYKNNRNNNTKDVFSYIDGNDIYNSKMLKRLKDVGFTKKYYITDNTDKRTDLVAKNIYNNAKYESFVMLTEKEFSEDMAYLEITDDIDTLISGLNL